MIVTQKQIAEAAGVSQPVVARVLSGHPHVALKTRERVEQIAAELGYSAHANGHARALAARRYGQQTHKGVIAVLYVSYRNEGRLRDNPFFTPLFEGVDRAAEERDVDVCFFPMRESGLPRMLTEKEVDGVICIGSNRPIQAVSSLRLPTIALDMLTPFGYGLIPDDREGARLATKHLIDLGHREIAYLSYHFGSSVDAVTQRLEGYQSALREAGIPFNERLVIDTAPHLELQVGSDTARQLLARNEKWTGLVCYNDLLAMGAVNAMREAGVSVPGDVSVVGFDDVSTLYHFEPALTSVAFDREAMGRRAVELLNTWSEEWSDLSPSDLKGKQELFPVELIERESTRCI